jgi:hypothetical protein
MWLIVKFLDARGGRASRAELGALLQPPTLILRRADSSLDASLRGLRDLALIVLADDAVRLAPTVEPSRHPRSFAAFSRQLRGAVLQQALNGRLEDFSSSAGPRDLTRALIWWVGQDIYGPGMSWDVVMAAQQDLPGGTRLFADSARYNAFLRWASALGFAETLAGAVVPDITQAVRDALVARLEPDERLHLSSCMDHLRAELPILEGGAYAAALEAAQPPSTGTQGDAIGMVVSHALLRLDDEGTVKLENLADAAKVLLTDRPGGIVEYSHMTRVVET